jgi:hypothetical protein
MPFRPQSSHRITLESKVLVLERLLSEKGDNTWFSHGAQFRHVHKEIADEKPLLPHVGEGE